MERGEEEEGRGRYRKWRGAGSGVDGRGGGGEEGKGQKESQLSDVANSLHAVGDRCLQKNSVIQSR